MARQITRRRLFGLAGAMAAVAAAPTVNAETGMAPFCDKLTLIRSGGLVMVKDASGETVYAKAGSVTWSKVSAAQLAPLATLIAADAAQMSDGVHLNEAGYRALLDDPEVAAIVEGTRQRITERGWV